MDISLTHRLSFKQASLTVLVAFILGALLSLIQVGLDYASEDASIDREIRSLLDISHNPAARIAYNIDGELAQELVVGLLRSPAVMRAEIVDNNGLVLASVQRPPAESPYRLFSDFLFGERRVFDELLFVSHAPTEALGLLRLEVDTFAFGADFLHRSLLTLLTGFVRSLLLALILLVLFYAMLTKPLVGVIRALSERDSRHGAKRIPCPPGHERDEIGILVETTNQQLNNIQQEINQRREAEDRLTQYLAELENIVSARTAELKATNARLTQSNRELEQARATALDMAHARAAFLANMSHEIRTPLNGLLGMLALTLDGPLSSEQRQQLAIAHDSGKVLVDLLNDILDLSKFEAGQLELEQIPFDLGTLAEETASLLSQNAAPNVELTCHIDPQLPGQLLGDPTRVRQIVSNLLSNALKFTRSGRVDLRIERAGAGVNIAVVDTGIGISEDAQKRIFHPFIQAGAGITRQFGGTGLGLALSRRLCEAMQGKLELVSREGYGSRFSTYLPLPTYLPPPHWAKFGGHVVAFCDERSGLHEYLQITLSNWGLTYARHDDDSLESPCNADLLICQSTAQLEQLRQQTRSPLLLVSAYGTFLPSESSANLAPFAQLARPLSREILHHSLQALLEPQERSVAPTAAPSISTLHSAQVLLVEDNPVNQMVATGMLTRMGCAVTVASHGAEAIAHLQDNPVSLVLMDCNMPVMDGYEATRRIRQSGRWPNLPIIALTANALPDERERCQAAGMNDYLAKPFRREELSALIARWLPVMDGAV